MNRRNSEKSPGKRVIARALIYSIRSNKAKLPCQSSKNSMFDNCFTPPVIRHRRHMHCRSPLVSRSERPDTPSNPQ